ncbi:MAG: hypothetical protein OEY65_09920 [Gammaproteobacteria bacterium]|nr:hypothetical protein [Gammaproteobacteria bacterium]
MSHKPRFVLPGVPQYVIQHGNNRRTIGSNSGENCSLIPAIFMFYVKT